MKKRTKQPPDGAFLATEDAVVPLVKSGIKKIYYVWGGSDPTLTTLIMRPETWWDNNKLLRISWYYRCKSDGDHYNDDGGACEFKRAADRKWLFTNYWLAYGYWQRLCNGKQ